jgi:hypothetical protein
MKHIESDRLHQFAIEAINIQFAGREAAESKRNAADDLESAEK